MVLACADNRLPITACMFGGCFFRETHCQSVFCNHFHARRPRRSMSRAGASTGATKDASTLGIDSLRRWTRHRILFSHRLHPRPRDDSHTKARLRPQNGPKLSDCPLLHILLEAHGVLRSKVMIDTASGNMPS